MPNTLRLKPHYLHLEDILPHTSPQHYLNNHDHLLNLRGHLSLLSKYPPHFQLYAFVTTISHVPHQCVQQLARQLDPQCLAILRWLQALPYTCPFQHKAPCHPSQLITTPNLPSSPTTAAYEYIKSTNYSRKKYHIITTPTKPPIYPKSIDPQTHQMQLPHIQNIPKHYHAHTSATTHTLLHGTKVTLALVSHALWN